MSVSLLLLLSLSLCACGGGDLFADRGSVEGYGGAVLVSAEVGEDGGFSLLLESAEGESAGVGDTAAKKLIELMNENQTVNVDVISGATVTSAAVIEASKQALTAAGVDLSSVNKPLDYSVPEEYLEKMYDVIIVGAGGAGLTAAIEAAGRGAEVLVIEKMSQPGGSTAISDGIIMASGTDDQANNLINDTAVSFASYLHDAARGFVNSTTVMQLADSSATNLLFLRESGVPISRLVERAQGSDVARNHIITDGSVRSGGHMIEPLVKAATTLGVTILCDLEVVEITSSVTGKVTGVRAREKDGDVVSISSYSVILATGGYDRNAELTKTLTGVEGSAVSYSALGSTGDGITLATDALAKATDGNGLIGKLYDFNCDTNEIGGLLVNPRGERFCNESDLGLEAQRALREDGYASAWLILDSRSKTSKVTAAVEGGGVVSAKTQEELASLIGAPRLNTTLIVYNYACKTGEDIYFNKSKEYLKSVERAPFYAVPYETVSYGSVGGLEINLSGKVVGLYGVIPGLYAAGELVNRAYFYETIPAFGASLAEVIETGRLAGEGAAAFAAEEKRLEAAEQARLEQEAAEAAVKAARRR